MKCSCARSIETLGPPSRASASFGYLRDCGGNSFACKSLFARNWVRVPAVGAALLQAYLETASPFADFAIGSSLRSDEREKIESNWIFLQLC